MFSRYKKFNRSTQTAIVAGFVLTVIVFAKLGTDGWGRFSEWRAEQARVAQMEAEQRAMAEADARKLRQEVETTTITLNEVLAAVKESDSPIDWAGKYQDAWGNDIKIVKRGSRNGWVVISSGPDGEFNTVDDVKREDSSFSVTGAIFGGDDEELVNEVQPEPEEQPSEPVEANEDSSGSTEPKKTGWRRWSPF